MSGYAGYGRLQDGEWLMRACMILNEDLPPHAREITPDTVINKVYTVEAAEFEEMVGRIDPEGELDLTAFPAVAYFNLDEGWPVDIIIALLLALGVWLFLPDWYGVAEFVAYVLILAYVAVSYLRTRRRRQLQEARMQQLGLKRGQTHPFTLRDLIAYRR